MADEKSSGYWRSISGLAWRRTLKATKLDTPLDWIDRVAIPSLIFIGVLAVTHEPAWATGLAVAWFVLRLGLMLLYFMFKLPAEAARAGRESIAYEQRRYEDAQRQHEKVFVEQKAAHDETLRIRDELRTRTEEAHRAALAEAVAHTERRIRMEANLGLRQRSELPPREKK